MICPTAISAVAAARRVARAAHLVDEVGELDAEGERLRVDAVGAAHHHGEPVPLRLLDQRRDERLGVRVDDRRGVAELGGERGVDDVRRGQAEVEVPPRLTDRLLDGGDERGHVVPLLGLELGDAFGIDRWPPAARRAPRPESGRARPILHRQATRRPASAAVVMRH